ncbi:MAG: phosphotransacetylase family protein, partial [Synechococcales cyanobacterium CRU_2_2]|nr:phosphotransacetylase family protein [Synechococcales cyanobacterium CRU_2_2]
EGPGTLDEGYLFELSLGHIAEALNASVLLVSRFSEPWSVDSILGAQQRLGDRVLGVVFNDVPTEHLDTVQFTIKPALEKRGICIFGIVPHSELLRSVSVAELVRRLNARVISSPERQNLMVESLCIGAMNVNSALEYFRKGHNMAVVTGGDRADLQLAALETSTQCLILTGSVEPRPDIVARAEEMEIPIISVDLDTLSTVEIIEKAFGEVRFHEQVKAQCISQMSSDHIEIERLAAALGLSQEQSSGGPAT